ncbi:MAG: hypothetical protein ACREA3_06145 [Nitrosotalea sp.]
MSRRGKIIKINSVGTDSYSGQRNTLNVNAIDVEMDTQKVLMPTIAANKMEFNYSKDSKIALGVSLTQFIQRSFNISEIRDPIKNATITKQYKKLIEEAPNRIGDFYFQYPKDNNLHQSDRKAIHKIQLDANALILSDYETNRYQNENEFETQILELRDEHPEKIVSPTIDIGIEDEELFAKKIDKIIKNDFDRFNIIFRSIPDNITNWIDLSHKIFRKNIWVNVVGTNPRWHSKYKMISQISRAFLFGVHSVSQGYPWRGGGAKAVILNGNTLCFETPTRRITYEASRAQSVITQEIQLANARRHIINGTYFSKFVPSKRGLYQSLISLA